MLKSIELIMNKWLNVNLSIKVLTNSEVHERDCQVLNCTEYKNIQIANI
jgi:hypothetical protein